MFHLMLGLVGIGAFAVVIGIMLIPLWLGPLVQAVIAVFSRGKAARWVPGALGAVGLVMSLYWFCVAEQVFSAVAVVLYWVIYGLLLWAADAVVRRIRGWLGRRKER